MKRIVRRRSRGWRMPPDAISVTRPCKWGNPLMLDGDTIYIHAGYRRKILSPWVILQESGADMGGLMYMFWVIATPDEKYQKFVNPDLQYWSDHFAGLDWNELRGRDLACWCSPSKMCHADVLIKIMEEKYGTQ